MNGLPELLEVVRCSKCGRLYEADSQDYIWFHGAVKIGKDVGLLGPGSTIWCRYGDCGRTLLAYLTKAMDTTRSGVTT